MAIKVLDKNKISSNDTRLRQLIAEIKVHWALSKCDAVLQMLELFEDNQLVYIVLEYQSQGTLLQQIMKKQSFDEKQSKVIMEQLLLAVDYMH